MSEIIEQKLDLDDEMLSELDTIDSFHDLPKWAVIVDRREKNPNRIKRDNSIIDFIDHTTSEIIENGIDEFNILDEDIRKWMIRIILMADHQRERMDLSPYVNDTILTLVYEIWYTVHLHRNNFRQSGENYAKSHLFESVIHAIRDQGVSDIFTIVSILRHDDLEDHKKLGFDKPRPDLLLCLPKYQHLLTGDKMYSSVVKEVEHFRKEVFSTVEAVSIYKKFSNEEKEKKHELNVRRALEAFAKYGMRPTKVRIAERIHNQETIMAKGPDDAIQYLTHSLKVYPKFAGFLDLDRARENLITSAYKFLDSDLSILFKIKSATTLNKRFGTNKKKSKLISILKKVGKAQFIKFLGVNPRKISDYVKGIEGDESIRDIDNTDPMFEIVILVDNEVDLLKAKDRISYYLKTSSELLEEDLNYSSDVTPQRGIRLEILNPDPDPELGGYLKIRINTVHDEARLDQGRQHSSETEEEKQKYKDFLTPINEVLDRTKKSTKGILEMVEEIGHGRNDIFTPERDKISIPVGGTVLAFSSALNTKLTWEIKGARIETKIEDKNGVMRRVWIPISPLDRLKHKSRIKIIKKGDLDFDSDIDTYEINYAWFEYAKSLDAQSIRKYFKSLSEEKRELKLAKYLSRLSDIVGIDDNELIQILLSKSDDHDVRKRFFEKVMTPYYLLSHQMELSAAKDKFNQDRLNSKIQSLELKRVKLDEGFEKDLKKLLIDISNGHLSPLKLLSNAAEEEKEPIQVNSETPLALYFEVPDRAGVFKEISTECEKIGLNIRFVSQKKITDTNIDRLELTLDITNPKTRIYDMLLVLLKLSERYKCVVLSDTFKKLIPNLRPKTSVPQLSE